MNTDFLTSSDDELQVEPRDLEAVFVAALTMVLAKRLAADRGADWPLAEETVLQLRISDLVAQAAGRGLSSITVKTVKSTGETMTRQIDLDRVAKERTLH
jgi:hypothetical protein